MSFFLFVTFVLTKEESVYLRVLKCSVIWSCMIDYVHNMCEP